MTFDFNQAISEITSMKLFRFEKLPGYYPWPERKAAKPNSPEAVVEELLSLLQRLFRGGDSEESHQKRLGSYLRRLATHIRKKNRYYLLHQYVDVMGKRALGLPTPIRLSILDDFSLLYLMLMKGDQILAGVRGGPCWKRVELPIGQPTIQWIAMAYQMLPFMGILGRGDVDLVPERFIAAGAYPLIRVPQTEGSIEELLAQAYWKQVYTLPNIGVEVEFTEAGDILRMLLKQVTDEYLVARVETPYGHTLAYLSLDNACGYSFETPLDVEPWLQRLIAEVYRDLVVAEDIERPISRRPRREGPVSAAVAERATVSYRILPRRVRRGGEDRIREPYRGPRRPPRPHQVCGHIRRCSMTEKHYHDLLAWQDDTGLRVPWHIVLRDPTWDDRETPSYVDLRQCGRTFVRPHFSPLSDKAIKTLPTFIKRGLQRVIDEGVGRE